MTTLGTAQRPRTPTGLKVAPMSYAKLEVMAAELHPLLPTVKARSGKAWMVDAYRVLERTLPQANYNYHVEDVDELGECAAFTVPESGLVVLRQDVYDGLFQDSVFSRSTVIHELSHIVLRHAVTLHRGPKVSAHEFFEDSEWQAKALTAAITMPVEACREAKSVQQLATLCGTSIQAASYRIQKLIERKLVDPLQYTGELFL